MTSEKDSCAAALPLTGKVALVTGGGRDMGAEIVIALAAAGASVVVNFCNAAGPAADVVATVTREGGRALAVQADVRRAESVLHLMTESIREFGRLDIVVNNAGGLLGRKYLSEMTEDFFEDTLRLNLTSAFLVIQAARPHLASGASIINMSSIAANNGGGVGASAYAAAKSALLGFTKALARELGPDGIRVNAVSPGLIGTSFHDRFSTPEGRAQTVGATSLRREGTPQDVAATVLFLASPSSAFVTGTWVHVDGGL